MRVKRVKCTTFSSVLAHSRLESTHTQVMPSFIPVRTLAGRSSKKIISCLQQRRESDCVSVAGARALGASIYLLFTFFPFRYQEGNTTSSLNFSQVRSLSLSCANLWTAHTQRSWLAVAQTRSCRKVLGQVYCESKTTGNLDEVRLEKRQDTESRQQFFTTLGVRVERGDRDATSAPTQCAQDCWRVGVHANLSACCVFDFAITDLKCTQEKRAQRACQVGRALRPHSARNHVSAPSGAEPPGNR